MRSTSIVSLLGLSALTAACAIAPGDPSSSLDPMSPAAADGEAVGKAESAEQTRRDSFICKHAEGGWTYFTMVDLDPQRTMRGFPCDSGGTIEEDVDMPSTKPVYTNNASNYSIWITVYDAGQLQHLDYGCVPAHSSRRWASGNYLYGSFYHVRAEVKYNADCTGATLFDTAMQINPQASSYTTFAGLTGLSSDLIVNLVDTGNSYYLATGSGKAGPRGAFSGTFDQGPFVIWSRVNDVSQVLSVDPACTTAGCGLVLEPYDRSDAKQQWVRSGNEHGMVFTNVQTGLLAYVSPGQGNRVQLLNRAWVDAGWLPITEVSWTVGGDFLSGMALRPLRDDGQNLNVFGNGPYKAGSAVGTWGWGGGSANETWKATRVSTQ